MENALAIDLQKPMKDLEVQLLIAQTEIEKFRNKGVKKSATNARTALMCIIKLSNTLRKQILEEKKAMPKKKQSPNPSPKAKSSSPKSTQE